MYDVKVILKDGSIFYVKNISSISNTDFEIIFLCIDHISSYGKISYSVSKFDISDLASIIFDFLEVSEE